MSKSEKKKCDTCRHKEKLIEEFEEIWICGKVSAYKRIICTLQKNGYYHWYSACELHEEPDGYTA